MSDNMINSLWSFFKNSKEEAPQESGRFPATIELEKQIGEQIYNALQVATKSMTDAKGAADAQKEVKQGTADDIKKANEHEKNMHNYQ